MPTMIEARQHEAGVAFIRGYASSYGTAEALSVVRSAVQAHANMTPSQNADVFAARVAGMCDALLDRVQHEARR